MEHPWRVTVAGATAALLAGVAFLSAPAEAAFTGSISNGVNAIGSGTQLLTATSGGSTQCTSVPAAGAKITASTFACSGSQLPAADPSTGTASNAVTLTASGTTTPSTTSYQAASCAPISLANTTAPTNPLLPRYGVTYGGAGPTRLVGSGSVGFDGTNSVAPAVVGVSSPSAYSIAAWFRTSVKGGGIIGMSSSPSATAGSTNDRMIFVTSAGTLSFTISGALGNATSITSPTSYADGAWHFVVGTMSGGVGGTQTLYVDGAAVASQTIALQLTSYTGYWRVGQSVNTGGGRDFFSGSISDAATWPGVMTAAQV
jgi:hypothetical protein